MERAWGQTQSVKSRNCGSFWMLYLRYIKLYQFNTLALPIASHESQYTVKHRITALDWALLVTLVIAWGSSFAMSKAALENISPEWVAATRLVIGAIAVLAYAVWNKSLPVFTSTNTANYTWLGFIGNAAPFLFITWGMQFTTSGVAGLLMGTIPLFVIVLAHFTLPDETLTTQKALGFILGFAGIVALIGPDAIFSISFNTSELLGELAIVLGCICYGINSVTAKRWSTGNAIQQSTGVLIMAALMSVAYAIIAKPFDVASAPTSALWAVLGLGLVPTGIATVVWFKAMQRTGPTFTALSNYLVPVYALAFGALTLNETIGLNALAALSLVLAGIALTQFKPRPS